MPNLNYDTKLALIMSIIIGVLFAMIPIYTNYLETGKWECLWFIPINTIIIVVFALFLIKLFKLND